jgi:hypothetical protein
MSTRRMVQVMVVAAAVMLAAWVPAMAGSAAIGSLAGSRDATLGGQVAMANTTVFSGDSLHVRDGVAVVAMEAGSRMVFGRQTEASFLKEGGGVTVLLGAGDVSLYHPATGRGMAVKAGEISVEPAAGYKTLGEVAMLGGSVVVTTKEGLLKVERAGAVEEVAAGKTMTLPMTTARAPMPAAPAPAGISGAHITLATGLGVGTLSASTVAAILAGLGIKRADNANSSASEANSTAGVAASNAATATSAANGATSSANAANSTANSVGCALNTLANEQGNASPYTPPAGSTCP